MRRLSSKGSEESPRGGAADPVRKFRWRETVSKARAKVDCEACTRWIGLASRMIDAKDAFCVQIAASQGRSDCRTAISAFTADCGSSDG